MMLGLGIGAVALCVLLQGFFSGSEMAMISANRAKLQAMVDEGHVGATRAKHMVENDPASLLGTCLIGTNAALVCGTTSLAAVLAMVGQTDPWLHALAYIPLGLLLGEAIPKVVYRHHADTLAPRLSRPLSALQGAMRPALWVVGAWTRALHWLAGSHRTPIRREDIVHLLDGQQSAIDLEDRQTIQRLLALSDVAAEDCMTPLVDVYAVPETATVSEAVALVLKYGHSRLPVYQTRVDNIVGVVEHRDLLFCADSDIPVSELAHPIDFVPDSKKVDALLREMRQGSSVFVAVVDEYGGSVGIITMEDILEEVLGEIEDERDRRVPSVRRIGEREWRVPARTEVDELSAAIDQPIPCGDYETVAGLLLAFLGRIPEAGETVQIGHMTFAIEAASERAIQTVRLIVDGE